MIIETTTANVLKVLSFTEMKIVRLLVKHLDGRKEAEIVASRIADEAKITRSMFITALGKLEASGIVYTTSLGSKGLYIKVINQEALEAIVKE